jgi:uncharacterized membrane protein YkoI
MDAMVGALGLMVLAGTGYAAASSDLVTGQPVLAQSMEGSGSERHEDEGREHGEAYEHGRTVPGNGTGAASSGTAASQPLTLQDAIARAGQLGYTRILEAEYEHGRYEIEALDAQGRKVELYFDAQTGNLLRQGYDD